MKCVETYRQGTWAETRENLMQKSFRRRIFSWDKIEKIYGSKGLERVKRQKNGRQTKK